MMRKQNVSMKDIAQHLNISQATVSYVLSGRRSGSVNQSTRERVLAAAQNMGYRPNRAAQAMAGHGSKVIELCVSNFYPPYSAQVLQAFKGELRGTAYELHVVNSVSGDGDETTALNGVWPVDGIITDVPLSPTTLASLMQRGTPVVSVGIYANRQLEHVFIDMMPALLEGLRHLAANSRRMAFVALWPAEPIEFHGDTRYRAYHQIIREAGLREEVIVVNDSPDVSTRAATREIVRKSIAENGAPDAFFCFNDERAIGTLAALRDLGLRVPQDVRILGCDGIEETDYHHPALSTIQYPFAEVARIAWEFLNHRLEQPDAPSQGTTLTPPLVLRASSAL